MSRRPKGGMGRKKVAKQEPLVSEAWGTLATTTISMLETVGSINEDANEDCIEEAAQLSEMNKKRMSFEDRLQLLDCVNQMVEGFLGAFGDLSAEDIEEHGVAEMYENFYGSIFTLVTESVEGINKDGAAPEQKEQLQQQLCMLLRLIDTVMAVSFDNHAVSALEYFRPFAGTLFELCCAQLCLGAQYDFFVRSMASSLLTDQIEGKYLNSFLADPANRSVVELIIDTCFKLCAKEDKKGEDAEKEDEEEDEENPMGEQEGDSSQNLGTQLLDTLTSSLTNDAGESIVAPMILDRSQTILNKADAPALETKSALICLAVVPEAAQKYARESAYLGAVLPLLFKFADAPHEEIVRGGAYIALAEHFEHLQPEIRGHQAQLLAAITAALQDPVEKTSRDTKAKACLPLHILVKKSETLPAEYLDASSPKNLMRFLLDQVKPFASKSAEEMTEADTDLLSELIMAVRDFAESYEVATREGKLGAAGDYFAPFVTEAFDLMLTLAQRSTHVVVKGQAASSSAIIAANMAEDTLLEKMPTLSTLLQSSMEDPELGEDEELADELYTVRQSMHATWSALARKLQGKIEPYVETHVPFICRALAAGYGDEDEEEEQEDEDGMPQPPSENQARDGERSYALECYRDFAAALGAKFLPFQDRCFTVLTENYTTYSSEVQASVIELAKELPQKLYPIETKPTAGVDLVLDAKHAELLKACKAIIVDYIQHATDPEVVEYALDFLAELLDVYGQIVVNDDAKTMEAIEKATKSLLKKDAPCQTVDPREIAYIDTENGFGAGGFGGFGGFGEDGEDGEDAEDDEEEEEEEEEEEQDAKCEKAECTDASCTDGSCHPKDEQAQDLALMESLFNTLGALAKAKGASFKSTLDAAWPRIVKLRKQKAYAGAISGFFADLGEALGEELFAEYRAQVLPLLLADINNAKTTPGVVRNSGFAVGQIFLKSSVESTKEFYDQAVSGLMNGLKIVQAAIDSATDKESSQYADFLGAKDNVIAAMARLLSVGGEHLAQRGEMVPLVVQGLPLANDFGENLPTYTAVEKILATTPNEILQPLYPQLLRTLATVVAKQGTEQGVTEEVAATIVRAARTILAAQPNLRAEVVDALEPEVKQAFTAKIDA